METSVLTEAIQTFSGKVLKLIESLSLAEIISRSSKKILQFGISVSDLMSRSWTTSISWIESVVLSDFMAKVLRIVKEDSFAFLSKIGSSSKKSLAEVQNMVSFFSRKWTSTAYLFESLSFSYNFLKQISRKAYETFTILPGLLTSWSSKLFLVYPITLTEVLSKKAIPSLEDFLSLAVSETSVAKKALLEVGSIVGMETKKISRGLLDAIMLFSFHFKTFSRMIAESLTLTFMVAFREILKLLEILWITPYLFKTFEKRLVELETVLLEILYWNLIIPIIQIPKKILVRVEKALRGVEIKLSKRRVRLK
jgi:hypothetical protein